MKRKINCAGTEAQRLQDLNFRLSPHLFRLAGVAGCSSQPALEASNLKMTVDAKDTYMAAKLKLAQQF